MNWKDLRVPPRQQEQVMKEEWEFTRFGNGASASNEEAGVFIEIISNKFEISLADHDQRIPAFVFEELLRLGKDR